MTGAFRAKRGTGSGIGKDEGIDVRSWMTAQQGFSAFHLLCLHTVVSYEFCRIGGLGENVVDQLVGIGEAFV
jgi:hypothetical protein